MQNLMKKISDIRKKGKPGYWGERVIYELEYLFRLSRAKKMDFDALLKTAGGFLIEKFDVEGAITKETALEAEKMLTGLSGQAKSYTVLCAAHAHIDMNWKWGWDETVTIVIDTFTTMLKLLKEYPQYKYSQSQASIYAIVEKYAPHMLEDIKRYIKEGRWEVTASTWVEGDKNLPNGESIVRHILYTKNYLSKLLDISPDSLKLNFEPDTFGHAASIPEILSKGGVKYYYFCRGQVGDNIFRWEAPSGESVIAYREPLWYDIMIEPELALYVPEFCSKYGIDKKFTVYGVGDHGGGPTRRDIERIMDMDAWPLFPHFKFSTYNEFFSYLEQFESRLPIFKGELNFVQTGCYTSQSRVKKANKFAENMLFEAEAYNSIAALISGYSYSSKAYEEAWRNTLFMQFHDILPGSCTLDPKEHAMGLFQETMAITQSRRKLTLQEISDNIDTSVLELDESDGKDSTSEGAGVGFGASRFKVSHCERGRGLTRIYHVFNPLPFERNEPAELTLWDWNGDLDKIIFKDSKGNPVEHQLLDSDFQFNAKHHYVRILIKAAVPACGYNTYILSEDQSYNMRLYQHKQVKVEKPDEYILENDYARVEFDPRNASITSFICKQTGEEMIDKSRVSGIFRFIEEDPSRGRTSWLTGPFMKISDITERVKIKPGVKNGSIRKEISYQAEFENSNIEVTISLDYSKPQLNYNVTCHWKEVGNLNKCVPQLSYYMPLGYKCKKYKYDIPFGTIVRDAIDLNVPANGWIAGLNGNNGKALTILSNGKYGFRGMDDSISLTLIRSSEKPDPYPEFGIHQFAFAVGITDTEDNRKLIENSYSYCCGLSIISGTSHFGTLPVCKEFFTLCEGSAVISSVKMDESSGDRMVVRLSEVDGRAGSFTLDLFKNPKKAYITDLTEKVIEHNEKSVSINGNRITGQLKPYSIATLCIEF